MIKALNLEDDRLIVLEINTQSFRFSIKCALHKFITKKKKKKKKRKEITSCLGCNKRRIGQTCEEKPAIQQCNCQFDYKILVCNFDFNPKTIVDSLF